jgi:hypothetical protein
MAFWFNSDRERGRIFAEAFARDLPDLPFIMDAAQVDPDDVRYVLTWTVPPDLDRFKNLEIVFSIGAGVDQFRIASLPPQVKIVRMVEDGIVRFTAISRPIWSSSPRADGKARPPDRRQTAGSACLVSECSGKRSLND